MLGSLESYQVGLIMFSSQCKCKSGMFVWQAIPRTLWLDKSGKQLVQWPILEIEKLRTNQVDLPNQLIEGGAILEVSGITAAQVRFSGHISIRHVHRFHWSHKPPTT